jgi:hypothetical protein
MGLGHETRQGYNNHLDLNVLILYLAFYILQFYDFKYLNIWRRISRLMY